MLAEEILNLLLTVDTAEELLELDLTLKLHKAVEHCFRAGRTARNEDINGDDLVDAIYHAVRLLERASADSTAAAGDDVFGLGELIIEANERRGHLVYDSALHHDVVGLTRRVAGDLESEAGHVVAGSAETHELDGAAARAEAEGPKGVGDTPVDELVELADHHVGTGGVEFLDELVDVFVVFEVFMLHRLDAGFFYCHLSAPFRQA